MTEQEAQQAQTIAEIKRTMEIYKKLENFKGAYPEAIRLLEIVDSQAQKIAEQANEIKEARRLAEEYADTVQVMDSERYGRAIEQRKPLPWETTDSKEVAR